MIVTLEPVVSLPLPNDGDSRSRGIHVSSIIRCIATEAGVLKPEWCEELSLLDIRDMSKVGIAGQLRMHIGIAWENHYLPLLSDVVKHPGEMKHSGIYMTDDGESLSVIITQSRAKHVLKVHEVKATYKSTKTVGMMEADNRSNFMWLAQLKAYAKGARTRYADLHVLFLCGDYKFPIQPVLMIFHFEFTQQEIDDNWDLLREYRDHRIKIEGI